MIVVVLDRVLDRDQVPVEVRVDVIDHRRQRGGLARSGGSGDDEEPPWPPDQFLADGRQADLFEGQELVGDQTQRDRDVAPTKPL